MKNILFVSEDKNKFDNVTKAFSNDKEYTLEFAKSGEETLKLIEQKLYSLVLSDEKLCDCTGIELAEKIIKINAMVNTALVSSLSDHDFHEASEGLGVLMKIPSNPEEKDGIELEQYLKKILGL